MSVFCLAAVTEKRHISSRRVRFHTHFSAMSSPGQRISPSLSLSAGKCWQTTEPWCRTVTGSAICSVLGRTERGNKGASGVVVSHHGCSARSKKKRPPVLPESASSQTIREMAEGFSCFKPGCTVQINERIVSISELMGVTSEAPERILKTRGVTGNDCLWPSLQLSSTLVHLPTCRHLKS